MYNLPRGTRPTTGAFKTNSRAETISAREENLLREALSKETARFVCTECGSTKHQSQFTKDQHSMYCARRICNECKQCLKRDFFETQYQKREALRTSVPPTPNLDKTQILSNIQAMREELIELKDKLRETEEDNDTFLLEHIKKLRTDPTTRKIPITVIQEPPITRVIMVGDRTIQVGPENHPVSPKTNRIVHELLPQELYAAILFISGPFSFTYSGGLWVPVEFPTTPMIRKKVNEFRMATDKNAVKKREINQLLDQLEKLGTLEYKIVGEYKRWKVSDPRNRLVHNSK